MLGVLVLILPAQHIRTRALSGMISPFHERGVIHGMSYGLSSAGYDIRIAEEIAIAPGQFFLASTVERFDIPADIVARLCDKSSWARQGIVVQNTIFEPGWNGYATLEISDHRHHGEPIIIPAGAPIAQLMFELLLEPTEQPYNGKYQGQGRGPQPARYEATS